LGSDSSGVRAEKRKAGRRKGGITSTDNIKDWEKKEKAVPVRRVSADKRWSLSAGEKKELSKKGSKQRPRLFETFMQDTRKGTDGPETGKRKKMVASMEKEQERKKKEHSKKTRDEKKKKSGRWGGVERLIRRCQHERKPEERKEGG